MGCQTAIASKIRERNADYILAVKAVCWVYRSRNQKQLYEDLQFEFDVINNPSNSTSIDFGHGRIETRKCIVINDVKNIQNSKDWEDIKTIIKVESKREFKNSERKTEIGSRYYILSIEGNPADFQKAIRSHWAIENSLHWTLDVAFSEDASRKRKENAAQNFSILNKIALNLLKNEKSTKVGVKSRRLKAGWDNHYLIKVLNLLKF
jgi:predicted transposase YbfD/YdcC